jgi:uncharacterized membrane protein YesL
MIRLAYLNILWLGFSVIGLIIFGFFPATAAMFTIVREWMNGEKHVRIFHTFWGIFRNDFFVLNGFSLLFFGVGYFLYYDLLFLQLNSGKLQFLYPVILFILIAYIITLLFFFPIFVHFRLMFYQYIKQSFLIAITSPFEVIQMIISVIILYLMVTWLPGMIPLFPGSLLAFAMTWTSRKAFVKVERRMR